VWTCARRTEEGMLFTNHAESAISASTRWCSGSGVLAVNRERVVLTHVGTQQQTGGD